jgi:carbamoyltransferase
MPTAALGQGWSDDELGAWLRHADLAHERPADIAEAVAEALAANEIVGWFQDRSKYGPRALGHRSLLANPRGPSLPRASERHQGPRAVQAARPDGADRPGQGRLRGSPAQPVHALHAPAPPRVAGPDPGRHARRRTARIQTVDPDSEPLVARLLRCFERRTGTPVLINTSFNTADEPIVDDPRDALRCFGSAPIGLLAMGSYLLRRNRPPR